MTYPNTATTTMRPTPWPPLRRGLLHRLQALYRLPRRELPAGLQSISAHALFVGSLGATPDGRTKQMLVSDGGVSPAQGRDICGPTAAMLSVAKLNHLEATNGALLNVKFHPSAVKGERGLENLCALTDALLRPRRTACAVQCCGQRGPARRAEAPGKIRRSGRARGRLQRPVHDARYGFAERHH